MSPVGRLVFKTREVPIRCLVGSTPTSSATQLEISMSDQPTDPTAPPDFSRAWWMLEKLAGEFIHLRKRWHRPE